MLHDLIEKLLQYLQSGGLTMIPLLFISVLMWTLTIYKWRSFYGQKGCELSPEELNRIMADCDAALPAGLARWQMEIIWEYRVQYCADSHLNSETLDALRTRLDAGLMKHIRSILILAGAAPLLGLLGTVTGMISTFDVISLFGTGNARALAGGISEALITTQSGLVVAVPGLLAGTLLYRYAEKIRNHMELFCIKIQNAAGTPSSGME